MKINNTCIELETSVSQVVGMESAYQLLLKQVDKNTLLLLSGGSTPQWLYEQIVLRNELIPGSVALIDERYGSPFHPLSNELMIEKTGLPQYLASHSVLYIRILSDQTAKQIATDYQAKLQELYAQYPKRIAIMGVGDDGHTAGILPDLDYDHTRSVINYPSQDKFGERITLTFEGLEEVTTFIVLLFGEKKQSALTALLDPQSNRSHTPAAFYSQIKKSVFIFTDLKNGNL